MQTYVSLACEAHFVIWPTFAVVQNFVLISWEVQELHIIKRKGLPQGSNMALATLAGAHIQHV